MENEKFALMRPLWGLGATYAVRLRLIGKLVFDFLLVIMELFSLGAFVLSQFTNVTDRQTEGQTEGQTDGLLVAITRLHAAHKNTL